MKTITKFSRKWQAFKDEEIEDEEIPKEGEDYPQRMRRSEGKKC